MNYSRTAGICMLFLLSAGTVFAHVLETDGPIQGVMHISPAHKPTAGEPAHLEFFLKNKAGKFDPGAYTFTLTITNGGEGTTTVPVTAHGSTLTAAYTFPESGKDYAATLSGSSTSAGAPSFSLDFDDIFVFPAGQHESWLDTLFEQHIAHVVLVILVILTFLCIVGYERFVVRKRAT